MVCHNLLLVSLEPCIGFSMQRTGSVYRRCIWVCSRDPRVGSLPGLTYKGLYLGLKAIGTATLHDYYDHALIHLDKAGSLSQDV